MSKIRVDQIETLDGLHTKDVSALVDDVNTAQVTTSTGTQTLADALGQRVFHVSTIEELKSLDSDFLENGQSVIVTTTNLSGLFSILKGDYSDKVASDPKRGVYVAFNDDPTGSETVAVRDYSPGSGVDCRWFGVVGDGITDDSEALQAACDYAKVVLVPEGVTALVGDVELDGVTICGGGTIIKKTTSPHALLLSGEGCCVTGLTFRPLPVFGQPNSDIKLMEGASKVRIIGNYFYGAIYSAIAAAEDQEDAEGSGYTVPVVDVVISDNTLDAQDVDNKVWYARGFFIHFVENLTITNNFFRNTGFDAIRLRENVGKVIVSNNQFQNIGDPDWPDEQTRDGIDTAWSAEETIITDNIFDTIAYVGIDVKLLGRPVSPYDNRRLIIKGNLVRNVRRRGISVSGTGNPGDAEIRQVPHVIISGNIVSRFNLSDDNVGDSGIYIGRSVYSAIVDGNIVTAGLGRGIHILYQDGSDVANKYVSVVNNHVSNNTDVGIQLSSCTPFIVSGNMCFNDNNLEGPAAQTIGISILTHGGSGAEPKSSVFTNNICKDNLDQQIAFSGTGRAADTLASYSGNVEKGPGAYATSARWKQTRLVLHGSASPLASDGSFSRGDIIYNANPSTGDDIGWICTESGNPGTWVSMGAL